MWGDLVLGAQADYFALLAEACESRREEGCLAVRSGIGSNIENGVAGDSAGAETIAELVEWLGELPASWVTRAPEPGLAERLVAAGCRPERSGHDMGARLAELELDDAAVDVVDDERALDEWLSIAPACGAVDESEADREGTRRVLLALGLGGDTRLVCYIARRGSRPVGIAQAHYASSTAVMLHVGVLPDERRRGVGRALAHVRLAEARRRGYEHAVLSPSPEGAKLYAALGFTLEPSPPDRWFYLPVSPDGP
jgi:GNAT superfamily N-acetyltransferase